VPPEDRAARSERQNRQVNVSRIAPLAGLWDQQFESDAKNKSSAMFSRFARRCME
jgi:hypothetical protein